MVYSITYKARLPKTGSRGFFRFLGNFLKWQVEHADNVNQILIFFRGDKNSEKILTNVGNILQKRCYDPKAALECIACSLGLV